MSEPPGGAVEIAEAVVSRATDVPGVTGLHAGMFGEVGTYLPGRRITGVRVETDHVDVHVVMEWGRDVSEVAAAVRAAVAEVAPGRQVAVTIEDVAAPDETTPGEHGA